MDFDAFFGPGNARRGLMIRTDPDTKEKVFLTTDDGANWTEFGRSTQEAYDARVASETAKLYETLCAQAAARAGN